MVKPKYKADSPKSFKTRFRVYGGWLLAYVFVMLTFMPLVAVILIFVLKGGPYVFSENIEPFIFTGPHRWLIEALSLGQYPPILLSSFLFTVLFSILVIYGERNPSTRLSKKAFFGPAAEKTHEHGSAVVVTEESELKKNTIVWDPTLPYPKKGGGVVYGYSSLYQKFYVSSGEEHTCIVGPPKSGKTRRILIQSIFAMALAEDAMVIIDPKGELYSACHRFLEKCGYTVPLLDFRNTKRSSFWNPLTELIETYFYYKDEARAEVRKLISDLESRTEHIIQAQNNINRANEEAEALARDIAEIFVPMEIGADESSFWKDSARVMIYALILLVCTYDRKEVSAAWERQLAETEDKELQNEIKRYLRNLPKEVDLYQRSFTSIEYLIAKKGAAVRVVEKGVRRTAMGLKDVFDILPDDNIAKIAFSQALNADAEPLSSIVSTVQTKMDALLSRSFKAISYKSSLRMKDLMDKKMAVFVVIPDEDPARAPVGVMFIQLLYKAMVKISNANGGVLPKRLQLIIEEKGSLHRGIPQFWNLLAVGRQRDMIVTFAIQNFEQLNRLYGENGAAEILGNCNSTVFLGTNTEKTAESISRRLGSYTYKDYSASTNTKLDSLFCDSKGESYRLSERRWLTSDEVLRWTSELGAIVFRSHPDANNDKNPFRHTSSKRMLTHPAIFPAPDISLTPANEIMGLGSKEHNQRLWIEDEKIDRTSERETIIPWDAESPLGHEQVVFPPGSETEEIKRLLWSVGHDEPSPVQPPQTQEGIEAANPVEKPHTEKKNPHKEAADITKHQIESMKAYLREVVLPHKPQMSMYEAVMRTEKKRIKEQVKKDMSWKWSPSEQIERGGEFFGYEEELLKEET